MGNTINDVGSWLYGKVWRPVERELFDYQGNVDQFVGNVVRWNPADVNTSDRAAAVLTLFAAASPFGCEPQEESSKPAEDISQFKDVAPEVSQKPAEDISQFKDVVPEVKDFSKEKGWVFCAKKMGDESKDFDCHSNKNIQNKMSKCVSLYDIKLEGVLYDGGDYHFDEMYYDYDKLYDFLLFGDSTQQATFCFKGDNNWPPSATQCLPLTYQPNPPPYGQIVYWLGGPDNVNGTNEVSISIVGGTDWPINIYFQIPDICMATYETPCADGSVCE